MRRTYRSCSVLTPAKQQGHILVRILARAHGTGSPGLGDWGLVMQQNSACPLTGKQENPHHFWLYLFLFCIKNLRTLRVLPWLRAGLVATPGGPMWSFIFREQKARNGNRV